MLIEGDAKRLLIIYSEKFSKSMSFPRKVFQTLHRFYGKFIKLLVQRKIKA